MKITSILKCVLATSVCLTFSAIASSWGSKSAPLTAIASKLSVDESSNISLLQQSSGFSHDSFWKDGYLITELFKSYKLPWDKVEALHATEIRVFENPKKGTFPNTVIVYIGGLNPQEKNLEEYKSSGTKEIDLEPYLTIIEAYRNFFNCSCGEMQPNELSADTVAARRARLKQLLQLSDGQYDIVFKKPPCTVANYERKPVSLVELLQQRYGNENVQCKPANGGYQLTITQGCGSTYVRPVNLKEVKQWIQQRLTQQQELILKIGEKTGEARDRTCTHLEFIAQQLRALFLEYRISLWKHSGQKYSFKKNRVISPSEWLFDELIDDFYSSGHEERLRLSQPLHLCGQTVGPTVSQTEFIQLVQGRTPEVINAILSALMFNTLTPQGKPLIVFKAEVEVK